MTDLTERREMETEVYQPAEDSFLLAEAATSRFEQGDRVLEVGCGSGLVAQRVAASGATVVAADLNPHACLAAADRGLETVRANLVEPFRSSSFDGVVFNPPYLPETPETDSGDWMSLALSGGEHGRAIINPFLDTVGRVLRSDGQVLLLVSSLTGIEAVRDRARRHGLTGRVVTADEFPYERLVVLAFEII
jgi:release factor glutamine methyltransferase